MPLIKFKRDCLSVTFLLIALSLSFVEYASPSDNVEANYKKLEKALGNLSLSSRSQDKKEYLINALKSFATKRKADDEETIAILNQWNIHLLKSSNYSNTDYYSAINDQYVDYLKAIVKLGDSIKKVDKNRSEYSPQWIDDLKNQFGNDFIQKSKKAILNNFAVIASSDYLRYNHEIKDVIYIESMLYSSYKDYIGKFLDFYEQELDDQGRKKLKSRKDAADALMYIFNNVSMASIYNKKVLNQKLAEHKAKKTDEKLFLFFKHHPLADAFDDSKALSDLRRAATSN